MGPFLQVGGQWAIVQDNGFRVFLNVHQNEDRFTASAETKGARPNRSEEATGFVKGPDFEMTIRWKGGAVGLYKASLKDGFFPGGAFLKGTTKDTSINGPEVGWRSDEKNFEIA